MLMLIVRQIEHIQIVKLEQRVMFLLNNSLVEVVPGRMGLPVLMDM